MANKASASVSITFHTPDNEYDEDGNLTKGIQAEVNPDDNGDDTNFIYGDTAYFRVYVQPAGLTYSLTATDGALGASTGNGTGATGAIEESVFFGNSNEATVGKPIKGSNVSAAWLGRSLGSISVIGTNTVRASRKGVARANLTYQTEYQLNSLTLGARDADEWPVDIWIQETGEDC